VTRSKSITLPIVSAPGKAFPEMAAVSGSDKDRWQSIFFLLPMPGSNFGFKIGSGDWVFGVISADVPLSS